MCKGVSQADLILFSELRVAGIPLDDEVVRSLKAAGGGLRVCQSANYCESYVKDLESGGTGYVLSVVIYNESDRIVRPCAYRLIPLSNERDFRWLEASSHGAEPKFFYRLPGETSGGFGPDKVLNHRLDGRYSLYPGDSLEGLLLGAGQVSIPTEYRDQQLAFTTLTIFDQRGIRCDTKVNLLMNRRAPAQQRASKEDRPRLRDLFREARERESRQLQGVA